MANSRMGENGPPGGRRLSGRCVVLVPQNTQPYTALITALTNKGVSVQCAHSEPAVMDLLAQGGVTLVVVAAPATWRHLAALCEAMHTYFPQVLYWQYAQGTDGKSPLLSRLNSPAKHDASQHGPAASPSTLHGPIGRIVGRRRVTDRLAVKAPNPPQANAPDTPLVSEEELSMLLGPDPGTAPGEAG